MVVTEVLAQIKIKTLKGWVYAQNGVTLIVLLQLQVFLLCRVIFFRLKYFLKVVDKTFFMLVLPCFLVKWGILFLELQFLCPVFLF